MYVVPCHITFDAYTGFTLNYLFAFRMAKYKLSCFCPVRGAFTHAIIMQSKPKSGVDIKKKKQKKKREVES